MRFSALIGLAAAMIAATANATPLNDYNLILSGDYNYGGGEVEGATIVGGDLNATGHSPTFGTRPFSNTWGVSVAGDLNATNINVNGGGLRYGGANNTTNINMNSGGPISYDPTLDTTTLFSQLQDQAELYSGLTGNGTFFGGTLTYDGTDDIAVFDLMAADLFAQNTTLKLNYGGASTVIINVGGTNISVGGGVNVTDGFRTLGAENILWNFSDATTIDFNGIGMYGAIIALNADTSGGSVFDGSFAARSYTGAREFHQFGFNAPSIQVPAPHSLLTMISVAVLILGRLVHRRINGVRVKFAIRSRL